MTVCNMASRAAPAPATSTPTRRPSNTCGQVPTLPPAPTGTRPSPSGARSRAAEDASYDDKVNIDAADDRAHGHLGHQPGPGRRRDPTKTPRLADLPAERPRGPEPAYAHMGFSEGREPIKGKKIDVAFIGSCTNGRISDLREAAARRQGTQGSPGRPGPRGARLAAGAPPRPAKEGLDKVFTEAGFEWRCAGCSMCLAMNPDKLEGDQLCASSSNRNFIGRQGSARGRTLLMSPAMVAAAAVSGEVVDLRSI